MKILIIEDEIKTARSLSGLLESIDAEIEVLGILQSVKSAVQWFGEHGHPDLVFMDIQLADGLSFEIFEQVQMTIPVIFCTAYNEYSIKAFKNNGVDYILKPFSRTDIEAALDKVAGLKNYFQKQALASDQFLNVLKPLLKENTKENFLVYHRNAYLNVPTSSIAYFYKSPEGIKLVTDDGKIYNMQGSLDELHRMLGKHSFYRVSRQYLVAFKNIVEVQPYFDRKLLVMLNVAVSEKLIVGREKATEFLDWLGNR